MSKKDRMAARKELMDTAVGVNESERDGEWGRERELGILIGTAHLVVRLTIGEEESYSDLYGQIREEIDRRAAKLTYPILPENGWKKGKKKKGK